MGTTNTQLRDMLINFGVNNFKGCYFKDEIVNIEPSSSYIFNLESQFDEYGNQNNGTHWVAIVTNNFNKAIYFDPFGQPAPKSLIKYLKNYDYGMTNKHIQSITSDLCGYFCVGFIYFVTRHSKRTKKLIKDTSIFLGLFEDLHKVKSNKNEYILSMFFKGDNKSILENNNNVFKKALSNSFQIEKVDLRP